MLPDTPEGWLNYLARRHDAELPALREYNDLYDGNAPLYYLHPEILRECGDRIKAVSLGWPMLAVDPIDERLGVVGFRYPESADDPASDDDPATDANLQRVWQANDLDEESGLGHLDALVMRRSYVTVGTNEDDADVPLVTVESPLEMYASIDPRTRKVRAALRRWVEDPNSYVRIPEQYATLYLPNATIYYDFGPNGWRETQRFEHKLKVPPVVPLTNRARLGDRYGCSELTPPLMSLSHAANKIASDMMVAAEFHALPLRAIFGVGPEDFVDEQGNRKSALQVIMGRLLAVPTDSGNDVKPFEFSSSALTNFHGTLDQLAKHMAGLVGLDPGVVGLTSTNPASADSIRAREARLIGRAERKQVSFGGGWEAAMRLVLRFQTGDWDPKARGLETVWRNAATPTRAQAADAATKLFTAGITPLRQTREDLDYTPGQIRRMEADDAEAGLADPIGQMTRALGQQAPAEPMMPVPAG